MTDEVKEAEAEQPKVRVSYLKVNEAFNLNLACMMLTAAGWDTYQVGSSLTRADYRDVDLRCILFDEDYDRFIGKNDRKLKLLNTSISEWLAARTGLPIDFQFQRMTEANTEFSPKQGNRRNYMGVPIYKWHEDDETESE